jgi:hypothetical protein
MSIIVLWIRMYDSISECMILYDFECKNMLGTYFSIWVLLPPGDKVRRSYLLGIPLIDNARGA